MARPQTRPNHRKRAENLEQEVGVAAASTAAAAAGVWLSSRRRTDWLPVPWTPRSGFVPHESRGPASHCAQLFPPTAVFQQSMNRRDMTSPGDSNGSG